MTGTVTGSSAGMVAGMVTGSSAGMVAGSPVVPVVAVTGSSAGMVTGSSTGSPVAPVVADQTEMEVVGLKVVFAVLQIRP